MDSYEFLENVILSIIAILAFYPIVIRNFKKIFRKHKKLSFIEQEYAREGRKCPSEAPGGPVTAEPICSNDISNAMADFGVSAEELSDLMSRCLTTNNLKEL